MTPNRTQDIVPLKFTQPTPVRDKDCGIIWCSRILPLTMAMGMALRAPESIQLSKRRGLANSACAMPHMFWQFKTHKGLKVGRQWSNFEKGIFGKHLCTCTQMFSGLMPLWDSVDALPMGTDACRLAGLQEGRK